MTDGGVVAYDHPVVAAAAGRDDVAAAVVVVVAAVAVADAGDVGLADTGSLPVVVDPVPEALALVWVPVALDPV